MPIQRPEKNVKQPVQARSLTTKELLMKAALEMYVKKGYHSTTMDEIAAEAGMSTGIAYRYFKNKKDILLASIEYAFQHIRNITNTEEITLDQFQNTEGMLGYVLQQFEALHRKYYSIHEELEGLRHNDPDVKRLYDSIEAAERNNLLTKIPEQLKELPHISERIALAIGIMEQYCHMSIDDKYKDLDFEYMRRKTIENVGNILFADPKG